MVHADFGDLLSKEVVREDHGDEAMDPETIELLVQGAGVENPSAAPQE